MKHNTIDITNNCIYGIFKRSTFEKFWDWRKLVNEKKMKTKMRRRKKRGFNKNEEWLEIKYSAPPCFLK
jgi:hypothetical protein